MNFGGSTLRDRLNLVRDRVIRACARSGRAADQVVLIGVTKTVPVEVVSEAVVLGLADLGENRVQEAEAKIAAVGRSHARWHLIGHLQRNKAGRAVTLFDRIHSVDDLELARAVSRRAVEARVTMPVLIEVNVSGEPSKFGVSPAETPALAEQVAALPALRFDGFMTVGAKVDVPDDARAGFARLRAVRDLAERRVGHPLPVLSMGMSGDFEVAIEEGSTMVRVGTALFGARPRAALERN
ncbi:MAG TPA: YggS family pyridoxal phosphate-dependent enzyme [Candidatus Eisenbacteria bacterium]|nr:YggS family pyridoxal phosphate-dependent enzyme [Candidatus Eisenbacteria bacterium]